MTRTAPRSGTQRKVDTLAKLTTSGMDVWGASASVGASGAAHAYLVPVSLAWIDERVVIALEADSRTARNLTVHGRARLALGPTRDVVIIDAVLDQAISREDVPDALAARYADQAEWDPRTEPAAMSIWSCAPSASRPGARPTNCQAEPSCARAPGSSDSVAAGSGLRTGARRGRAPT